jgi:hexosaminidase
MKIYSLVIASVMLACSHILAASVKTPEKNTIVPLIPAPQKAKLLGNQLTLSPEAHIGVASKELLPLAKILQRNLYLKTQIKPGITTKPADTAEIQLVLDASAPKNVYTLTIDKQIVVTAADYESMACGVASAWQLIGRLPGKAPRLSAPKIAIMDFPELQYRGVMIDVARMPNPLEILLETIDLMHVYKFNYLQIHFSDDQSYTLPSKAFPQLPTNEEKGSCKYKSYTFEEIERLVEYAKAHGITIIPEIDVPGHAVQLVKKLPEHFSYKIPKTGKYRGGNCINMVSEKTYEALEKLLDEIVEMFPYSPYIHIGGDEVYSVTLKKYDTYRDYTRKHNLKRAEKGDLDELLCHFIGRVNTMLNDRGRQSIVWEGFRGKGTENAPIPTNIIVMAWNTSYQTPQSLCANGFNIINCTWIPLYVTPLQNRFHSHERVFNWNYRLWDHWKPEIDPIQLPLDNTQVIGAQICAWSHWHEVIIPFLSDLMPAVSERIWNPDSELTLKQFETQFSKIKKDVKKIINPVTISADGLVESSKFDFDKKLTVSLSKTLPGTIRFTLDKDYNANYPTGSSAAYTKPFEIDETTAITAALFDKKGNQIGGITQIRFNKIDPAYYYRAYSAYPLIKENNWMDMPDFTEFKPDRQGVLGYATEETVDHQNRTLKDVKKFGCVNIRPEEMWNSYAIVLKGQMKLPVSGEYQFKFMAKDGRGELLLDGQKIAFNSVMGESDSITAELTAGTYLFTINYVYRFLFNELNIQVKVPGSKEFIAFEDLVLPIAEYLPKSKLDAVKGKLTVVNQNQKKNWNFAINKPVTTTGLTNDKAGNIPKNAVDGNTGNNSHWHGGAYPQSITVDLESLKMIDKIKVVFYYRGKRYYQYDISTSTGGIDWKEVVDASENKEPSSKKGYVHEFKPTLARYIKLTVSKNSANRGVHVNEIMVYGPEEPAPQE